MSIIKIHNAETNEVIEREMTEAEITEWDIKKAAAGKQAEAAAKAAAAKAALLEKLGITEDEAKQDVLSYLSSVLG